MDKLKQRLKPLLRYSTIKIVTIDDPFLGAIHYAFQIAIFAYIIIFQVVYRTGYLSFAVRTGRCGVCSQRLLTAKTATDRRSSIVTTT